MRRCDQAELTLYWTHVIIFSSFSVLHALCCCFDAFGCRFSRAVFAIYSEMGCCVLFGTGTSALFGTLHFSATLYGALVNIPTTTTTPLPPHKKLSGKTATSVRWSEVDEWNQLCCICIQVCVCVFFFFFPASIPCLWCFYSVGSVRW